MAARGIQYEPFLYAAGLFDRSWKSLRVPVETHLKPYVEGRVKVSSTTPLSAGPVLVIVLHGDLFNPTPSYQYAFAQALTPRLHAPVMPDPA